MRVVVADDSILLREGLVRLLEEAGLEVVGQAGDAEELLRKVRAHKPDVAVVDVRMPPTHTDEGLRAAREIRAELPERRRARALPVRRGSPTPASCWPRAPRARLPAQGPRRRRRRRLTDAVRRVGGGGSALDPEVVSQLLGRRRRDDPLDALTPREREVLGLMAEGRSNAAIAAEPGRHRARRREARDRDLLEARAATRGDDHRRVLAVLRFLDGPGES